MAINAAAAAGTVMGADCGDTDRGVGAGASSGCGGSGCACCGENGGDLSKALLRLVSTNIPSPSN